VRTRKKCILATKNKGKIREFKDLFKDMNIDLVSALDLESFPKIKEDGKTFLENALKKARIVAEHYGTMAISDDSGLEVDALNGRPGIYSARFAGEGATDEANNQRLLKELEGIPRERRTARFRCVIVAYRPDGKWVHGEGTFEGLIALEPKGRGGFGYDPVFFLPEFGVTVAELSATEKNRISHRARALKALYKRIKELL